MTTDYSTVMDAVERHIAQQIMKTTPSKSRYGLPKWARYKGEDIEEGAKIDRLFDIVEDTEGPTVFFTGNGVNDYDGVLLVKIAYNRDPHINKVAHSDYTQIRYQLMESDKTDLYAAGFDMFEIQEQPSIPETDDEEDYRIMEFRVGVRVSVEHR